jgi:phage baseplate assembly protein W
MPTTNTILAGISFPFRIQGNGLPASAMGVEVIRSALILLLRTRQRTRVMRPSVGMLLHTYIFEDNDSVLQSLITREILTQIGTQLPMVDVQDIQYTQALNNDQHNIMVNVIYIVQGIVDQTGDILLPS